MNSIKTQFWFSQLYNLEFQKITILILFGVLFQASLFAQVKGDNLTKSTSNETSESLVIQDGRLVFSHQKQIQDYFEKLERMDEIDQEAIFNSLYKRGFYSLLTMSDEESIEIAHAQNRQNLEANAPGYTFDEYGDPNDDEEIISFTIPSDEFAAMLNGEGEIEVAGKIYKYTPNGLFIVDKKRVKDLNRFLDRGKIAFPKANPNCNGELTPIGDEGFIDWYYCNPCPGCWGPPNPTTPPSPPQPQTWEQFYANSIQVCDEDGALISNIFGTVKVCKDYYSNEKRVKTKFWNQNFYIVFSTGIKTKYQIKKWYGWTKRKVDEIRLGINRAYYEYNISLPESDVINAASATYVFDDIIYPVTGFGSVIPEGNGDASTLPELPFDSDFEIIIPIFNLLDITVDGGTINEAFWTNTITQAENWLQSNLGQEMPNAVTVMLVSPQKFIMIHQDEYHDCTNCKKKQYVFDWGFGGGFSMPVNGSEGNISPVFIDFDTPENMHIDFYGAARRVNTWKGSRISF